MYVSLIDIMNAWRALRCAPFPQNLAFASAAEEIKEERPGDWGAIFKMARSLRVDRSFTDAQVIAELRSAFSIEVTP